MNAETISIDVASRFGVRARQTLLAHPAPVDRLLVMLPGKGYTCDFPLFYFLRRAAFALGFDVLSMQYGFQVTGGDLDLENVSYLLDDARAALEPTLERGYRQVCIAGKSLGTPLAGELARTLTLDRVSLLLLTPIGGALHGLGDLPALALIGTADALYSAELVAAFDGHPTIAWKVYDGLNHSLEVPGDWRASLAALADIIQTCEQFLQQQHP